MDARRVTREIEKQVWPFLREAGFEFVTGRNAWRCRSDHIDVVNFQSLGTPGPLHAAWTSYSFAINLGCYMLFVPPDHPGRDPAKNLAPPEYSCHFRQRLRRSVRQAQVPDEDVWYIDPDGKKMAKAVHDARMALARDGIPWFEMFADTNAILELLMQRTGPADLWEAGRWDSPRRSYLIGYIAKTLGHRRLAREHLLRAAASPVYATIAHRLETDAA